MINPNEAKRYLSICRSRPWLFVERQLGIRTWSGMRLVLDSVFNNQRTTVRAAHGIGKTFTAATAAVTFYNLYRNCQVITTAPTNRQVELLLWKEIREIYSKHPELRGECQQMQVKDDKTQSRMIGFSTDTQTAFEGQHAPNILWIVDEAKGCPSWLYKAIEGSMTGGNCHVLEISTTDGADQQCAFRVHHNKPRFWKSIKFSAFDSPFVDPDAFPNFDMHRNKELFRYGKPEHGTELPIELSDKIQVDTQAWIYDRYDDWYESDRIMWETKVCGDFGSQDAQSIIPLEWVMSAVDSCVQRDGSCVQYGEDIGERGIDATVQIKRAGGRVEWIKKWNEPDTMVTTGMLIVNASDDPGVHKVDRIGVGSGVFSRLAELGQPVIGIDSSQESFKPTEYYNFRAEMWGNMREIFKNQFKNGGVISIPNDPELIEDLTSMQWKTHSSGKRLVEDKKDFRKRHEGRSPNKGDALVYAFAPVAVEG